MKIMGLRSSVHWLGWFITKFILVTITVTLLTAIMVFGDIVQFSDPTIVWLLLELYGVSTILFAFLVSTFFGSARLASACGGLLYVACFFTRFFLHYLFFGFLVHGFSHVHLTSAAVSLG